MTSASVVENVVLAKLEELSQIDRKRIRYSDTLLGDLGIIGDDIGLVLVPEVERILGTKTNVESWRRVVTVQDAIDVFARALSHRPVSE
jgi:hypothetical protein